MAEWQNNELAGVESIAYLVAAHADVNGDSVEPEEIVNWPLQHDFVADVLLLDNGRTVIDAYVNANPGPKYTQAVTVIIDKQMVIRKVGGTYDTDHEANLALLLELANE